MKNTVVKLKSKEEFDELMEAYEKVGWVWREGENPKEYIPLAMNSVYTTECFINFEDLFAFSNYLDSNYKFIKVKEAIKRLKEMYPEEFGVKNIDYPIDFKVIEEDERQIEKENKKLKKELKRYKKRLHNKRADHLAAKDMKEHYEDLFNAGVRELRFKNICVEHLLTIIDEVYELTKDETIKDLIENGKNRHNLDKIIHAKKIFNK
jgi:hypothetical protein